MSKAHNPFQPPGNDGTVFKCPICRKYLPNADVKTFPFCSDKCRLLDLNKWLEGGYQVSRPMTPTDEENLPHAPPQRRRELPEEE